MKLIISSIFAYGIQASHHNTIECTPLEGGNYADCNANCSPGNSDCYYGTLAPLPDQICYCYTDKYNSKPIPPKVTPKPKIDIECSPLQGGNYKDCNAKCFPGNPDCYYGGGAAAPGQICYCYTDKEYPNQPDKYIPPPPPPDNKIECTSLYISKISYEDCNKYCSPNNPECYYGSGAAEKDQLCYCWTDKLYPNPPEKYIPPPPTDNKIECTSLRISLISYEECNKDCSFPGNDLCYYGAGAASEGQLCYCYTNTHVTTKKPTHDYEKPSIECTPLEGGNYYECNRDCFIGNPNCYYGNGAASKGQECYCFTDGKLRRLLNY